MGGETGHGCDLLAGEGDHGAVHGEVEEAVGADAAVHILPELARFRLKHPKLAVRLVTGNSAQLVKRLEDFSIDIAITAGRPSEPGLEMVPRTSRVW